MESNNNISNNNISNNNISNNNMDTNLDEQEAANPTEDYEAENVAEEFVASIQLLDKHKLADAIAEDPVLKRKIIESTKALNNKPLKKRKKRKNEERLYTPRDEVALAIAALIDMDSTPEELKKAVVAWKYKHNKNPLVAIRSLRLARNGVNIFRLVESICTGFYIECMMLDNARGMFKNKYRAAPKHELWNKITGDNLNKDTVSRYHNMFLLYQLAPCSILLLCKPLYGYDFLLKKSKAMKDKLKGELLLLTKVLRQNNLIPEWIKEFLPKIEHLSEPRDWFDSDNDFSNEQFITVNPQFPPVSSEKISAEGLPLDWELREFRDSTPDTSTRSSGPPNSGFATPPRETPPITPIRSRDTIAPSQTPPNTQIEDSLASIGDKISSVALNSNSSEGDTEKELNKELGSDTNN